MIRLHKLHSTPAVFDPIIFQDGLNFILGEKTDGQDKRTNGVGKTMAIEFLNFCLLKKEADSRVMRIPDDALDPDTTIHLDLTIGDTPLRLSRSVRQPNTITIDRNKKKIEFDTVSDAADYLENLYFKPFKLNNNRIRFRNLISPLLRDEKSEFNNILQCFDIAKRVPANFLPHLFFFGFDCSLYTEILALIDKTRDQTKYFKTIEKQLIALYGKVDDAKAQYNGLNREVAKLNDAIDALKTKDSFDLIQDDLVNLESKLETLRSQQAAIHYKLTLYNVLPEPEPISDSEMTMLFNHFESGLGDFVKRSLDDTRAFKAKIDDFKNTIVANMIADLRSELAILEKEIQNLDDLYSKTVSLVVTDEVLGPFKSAVAILNEKNQNLNRLRAQLDNYDAAATTTKHLKHNKDAAIADYDDHITENKPVIKAFEKTILYIHEQVIGNTMAHFDITVFKKPNARHFLKFDMRTDDDGSWGTERAKVFIYDMALLLNETTRQWHPGFLVHDNLFNVDNDCLEKSLNFIHAAAQTASPRFQYILTLNRDMVELLESRQLLNFSLEAYVRASFSKDSRFLKTKYIQE